MATRELTFADALKEGLDQCMAADPTVYAMGLGVPDPKGTFGTTAGLAAKHGAGRVLDMPTSENGMTGVAIGSALVGMRPVMTHQRVDFALLALDQVVTQAAKWHYMFGGRTRIPLVIRLIIGRGWGQGAQHSASLQSWFAHIPGLKVVMPATPHDAKGLLIASIEDDNPVIFLEHRWLHNIRGPVPEGMYRVPIGPPRLVKAGDDVTIAASSYMTLEALRAAEELERDGVSAEVIDVRTMRPLDEALLIESVQKTGRLVAVDNGWTTCGFTAELVALVAEAAFDDLKAPPKRLGFADAPAPTSPALSAQYYPRARDIEAAVRETLGRPAVARPSEPFSVPLDVPDPSFTGPF